MQWIKEVEMVDSVDDLRSSSSVRGLRMPIIWVLDARIAPVLKRIIHNSHFKRRIRLEREEQKAQKQDSFLRGTQIDYLIYDYFWVTGSHDSVENYADLFTVAIRNDDIQEFDSKWDGIFVYDENPTWWHLGRIAQMKNTRVWETQDRIGIVWPGDSSEEVRTWYHRLKTMVKRSIEQDIRNKNFGSRNRYFEMNDVVKNQGNKTACSEIVGNGEPTDSVWKETIAVSATIWISVEKLHSRIRLRILSCSRMSEKHREPEVPEARVPVVECLDGLARIT